MKILALIIVVTSILTDELTCTTVDGHVAAISEKYLDDAISYAVDKDHAALQKLVDAKVVIVMKGGIKVYIVKAGITKVQFRAPGGTDVLWTVREGVKCQ